MIITKDLILYEKDEWTIFRKPHYCLSLGMSGGYLQNHA